MQIKQAEQQFIELWAEAEQQDSSLVNDSIAKRTAYNDYTDMLCKDGELTEDQYNHMPNPF